MDPISAIGLVSSVLGIVDLISKGVKSLSDLRSRYKIADFKVTLLIGQLSTLSAALSQVATFVNGSPGISQDAQLVDELSMSVSCVEAVIRALDDRLSLLEQISSSSSNSWSRINFLWEESEVKDYLSLLDSQVIALNLFLTALQCRTALDQRAMLERSEYCELLSCVRDDTSSLLWLRDSESVGTRRSVASETFDAMSASFIFDSEIAASKLYRLAMKFNMKRAKGVDRQNPQAIRPLDSDALANANNRPMSHISESSQHSLSTSAGSINVTTDVSITYDNPIEAVTSQPTPVPPISWQFWNASLPGVLPRTLTTPKQVIRTQISQAQLDNGVTKILILGTAQSGKSTLIKSLDAAYRGYDASWLDYDSNAIQDSLKLFLAHLPHLVRLHGAFVDNDGLELPSEFEDSFANMSAIQEWLQRSDLKLWRTFSHDLLVARCPEHFFTSAERILHEDYVPTVEDILWYYCPTCGISDSEYAIDDATYRFHDVPGSRSGRRKWEHIFHDTNTVVYMFDVSCYHSVLPENNELTSMTEAYVLWDFLVNDTRFRTTNFVVMFTKEDLLTGEELEAFPFGNWDSGFTGRSGSREDVLQHMTARLKALIRDVEDAHRSVVFCHAGSITESLTDMATIAVSAIKYADLRRQRVAVPP